MKHLTENQLNEYFDGELDNSSRARAEAHLEVCGKCRHALEELRGVASVLANLPEETPAHDLAAPVLAKLPQPRTHLAWKLVLTTQVGVALGVAMLVIANLLPLVNPEKLANLFQRILPALKLPSFSLPAFSLPAIPLQPSTTNLIFLAASALLLWSVGNAVLLRGRPEVRK